VVVSSGGVLLSCQVQLQNNELHHSHHKPACMLLWGMLGEERQADQPQLPPQEAIRQCWR
jgi:hypothetical protein